MGSKTTVMKSPVRFVPLSYASNFKGGGRLFGSPAGTYVAHEPVRPLNGWKNDSVGGNSSFNNGFVIERGLIGGVDTQFQTSGAFQRRARTGHEAWSVA